ncbi:MAG: glycoside hydrolase family 9 protein [Candidatus Eisenbacteria bacterium]
MLQSRLLLALGLSATLLAPPGAIAANRYLRPNLLGYAPSDPKQARLLSKTTQSGAAVRLLNWPSGTVAWNGTAGSNRGAWGTFGFTHGVDFSSFTTPGLYRLEVVASGERSVPFAIGGAAQGGIDYEALGASLLSFLRTERCGATQPLLHDPCHLLDAAHIVGGPNNGAPVNVTGGWHDAGDYIKFLTTEACTVEYLLLAEEARPGLGGDLNGNEESDLLDEALIGVRHLLKLRYAPGKFLYQVQDAADHDQGIRMPEDDGLAANRPAFYGAGKNHLGRYAAAMARAARVWKLRNAALAESCRVAAIDAYATAAGAPNLGGVDFYTDAEWRDKLGLGAIELYLTTGTTTYLNDAISYSNQVGAGYWFGWDTLNALLHALLTPYYAPARTRLEEDLTQFQSESNGHPFGMCATEVWGTNLVVAGECALMLQHERITGLSTYATTAFLQRDFLLGTNPWGVSFVGDVGAPSPHDLHNQVGILVLNGALPGCLTEGPAPAADISGQGIVLHDADEYAEFQASRGTYHDDRNDYVTNEPTIVGNALAIWMTALFAARGLPPSEAPELGAALVAPRLVVVPNPAHGGAELRLELSASIAASGDLPANSAVSAAIFDASGRLLRELPLRASEAGDVRTIWDGRDAAGRVVPPGVYWALAGAVPARIVCLR